WLLMANYIMYNFWVSTGGKPASPLPSQSHWTLNCNVAAEVRIPCGSANISADECQGINCCFDGQSCFFGSAVTVQCTKDGQFIVVVAKDSTLPRLVLESITLLGSGQGCTHADSNSQFAIYQFPVTKCGSHVMEDSDAILYENRLSSSYEVGVGPYGSITRDSQFELLFQCKYTGSAVETVIMEVVKIDHPIHPVAAIGPINVQLRLANGQCQTKGCYEAYTSYYTEYPVTKVLRDPVYVEVQLMDKTDPLLVLRLGRCWVTTSPNPHTLPQWDILINGCPYNDDRYISTIVPIGPFAELDYPSHYRRFFFKMFTFVDTGSLSPLTQQIYIHCSTDVCDAKPGHNCEPRCYRQSKLYCSIMIWTKYDHQFVNVQINPLTFVFVYRERC
uniref:Zona pellucida sperm-binding protein 4 n=1 Tax=Periophthalmus magnuspinnatus TaxID=409849 RepID=A0A3B4BGA2_9GOBI